MATNRSDNMHRDGEYSDVFEQQLREWLEGKFVLVEELVANAESFVPTTEEYLDLIASEVDLRRGLDRSQQLLFLEQEYLTRFPSFAEGIRQWFAYVRESVVANDTVPPNVDPQAPRFPGCRTLEEIGSGGSSVVWKVEEWNPRRLIAVKELRNNGGLNADRMEQLRREAFRVAHLYHRNIIQILRVDLREDCPYFCMPWIPDGSLEKHKTRYFRKYTEIARIIAEVAEAIDYAHKCQIFHCDLKLTNILMDGARPLVSDFGTAVSRSEAAAIGNSSWGSIAGTRTHMAPEQFQGSSETVSERTDVYGLGACLYELLTGAAPNHGETWSKPPQFNTYSHGLMIPEALRAICLKCVAREPGSRYASAAEVADDLRRFLSDLPVQAHKLSGNARRWHVANLWIRRHPAWTSIIVSAAIAVAILTYVQHEQNRVLRQANDQISISLSEAERQRDITADLLLQMGNQLAFSADNASADSFYDRSVRHFEWLTKASPGSAKYQLKLAIALSNWGILKEDLGEFDSAMSLLQRSRAILLHQAEPGTGATGVLQESANIHSNLGNLYLRANRFGDAAEMFAEARKIRENDDGLRRTPESLFGIAKSHLDFGNLYMEQSGKLADAEAEFREAVSILDQLLNAGNNDQNVMDRLVIATNNLGKLLSGTGKTDEAIVLFRESLKRWEKLLETDQNSTQLRERRAIAKINLGYCIAEGKDRWDEGDKHLQEAGEELEYVLRVSGFSRPTTLLLAESLMNRAVSARLNDQRLGGAAKKDLACRMAERAVALVERSEADRIASPEGLTIRASANSVNGYYASLELDTLPRALDYFREATEFLPLESCSTLFAKKIRIESLSNAARIAMDLGKLDDADEFLAVAAKEAQALWELNPEDASLRMQQSNIFDASGIVSVLRAGGMSSPSEINVEQLLKAAAHFTASIETGAEASQLAGAGNLNATVLTNTYARRATVYERLGEWQKAKIDWTSVVQRTSDSPTESAFYSLSVACLDARTGNLQEATDILEKQQSLAAMHPQGPYVTACAYSLLVRATLESDSNDFKDSERFAGKSFEMLEIARQRGFFANPEMIGVLKSDPDFSAIRDDQRWPVFLASLEMKNPG